MRPKVKIDRLLVVLVFLVGLPLKAQAFIEKLPVYGVIKPGAVTTVLAVNQGMVSKIPLTVGSAVKKGQVLIQVLERETIRNYRSSLSGKVAKLHVTQGATVSPGMPLTTAMDPNAKRIEISFSPQEAQRVKVGVDVSIRESGEIFGKVSKVSPLVDPDTGGVLSYVMPEKKVSQLIGDVVSLDVHVRKIENCTTVKLRELDQYLGEYRIEAISGRDACLMKK